MKKIKRIFAVLSAAMLLNSQAGILTVSAEDSHTYDNNGFCTETDCTAYEPADLTTGKHDIDGDGNPDAVYEIGNTGQLYWFAEYVNSGNRNINAILTADITVNENVLNDKGELNGNSFISWTPIGGNFSGKFDGANHTISGFYSQSTNTGMFEINYGSISNLNIKDSYFKADDAGGICAYNYGTITNCSFSGIVISGL